jgi:Uncharacterized protein conserved in bacteria (DUF2188)
VFEKGWGWEIGMGQDCRGISVNWRYVMSKDKFYIEQRPDGQYSVKRPNAERASVLTPTQRKGIDWANEHGDPKPHIGRVRHTPKGNPDKWRKE